MIFRFFIEALNLLSPLSIAFRMCRSRFISSILFSASVMLIANLAITLPISQSNSIALPWNVNELLLTTQHSTITSQPCIHTNLIHETLDTRCFDLTVDFDHCTVKVDSSKASPLLLRQELQKLYLPGSKHPAQSFGKECLFGLDQANHNAVIFWGWVASLNCLLFSMSSLVYGLWVVRRATRRRLEEMIIPPTPPVNVIQQEIY